MVSRMEEEEREVVWLLCKVQEEINMKNRSQKKAGQSGVESSLKNGEETIMKNGSDDSSVDKGEDLQVERVKMEDLSTEDFKVKNSEKS